MIDVGYAGVIGADRIVDGDRLYGEGFSEDVEKGDTYGPVNYLLYVPFEQALRWSGAWDDLPAAHGAAIAFDLLTLRGLLLLGRALRPGREGTALGVALAYAWVAYPYTAFALETNSNDTLVALACIGALLGFAWRSAALSGIATGLGAASKFAPLALAPLFARRSPLVFAAALSLTRPRRGAPVRRPTPACVRSTTGRSATRRVAARRSAFGARPSRWAGSRRRPRWPRPASRWRWPSCRAGRASARWPRSAPPS